MLNAIKSLLLRLRNFLLGQRCPKENLVQFMVRQFLVPDSEGNPSWTQTILAYTMTIVRVVAVVECELALKPVKTVLANGTIIEGVRGFSSEFMYLIIGLSVIITTFARMRSRDRLNAGTDAEAVDPTPIAPTDKAGMVAAGVNKAVEFASSVLGGGKK